MYTTLLWVESIVSVLLILSVLVQNRGSGLGSLAGGSGNDGFRAERRGAELLLHKSTIFLSVVFCANAFFLPLFSPIAG